MFIALTSELLHLTSFSFDIYTYLINLDSHEIIALLNYLLRYIILFAYFKHYIQTNATNNTFFDFHEHVINCARNTIYTCEHLIT